MAEIIDCFPGQSFQGFVLVKAATLKTSSNGSRFWDLQLSDKSGEINAKIWNAPEGMDIRPQYLYKVRGKTDEYQGRMQLIVERIRLASEGDRVSLDDFVPTAPRSADDMMKEIFDAAEGIGDDDLRMIVLRRLEQSADALRTIPASMRNHHAYRGGLLHHTTTMLASARALLSIYTWLNEDLLISGVLLHDLCKIEEYVVEPTGLAGSYSFDGQMIGHLVQGAVRLEAEGCALGTPKEKLRMLQHMMISHHYEPEYGSPRYPNFPEAEMLHWIDIIDARMEDMRFALRAAEAGTFTDRIWSLENRRLYKHTMPTRNPVEKMPDEAKPQKSGADGPGQSAERTDARVYDDA